MKVALVEPYSHYPGHFPEEAKTLANALNGEGAAVTLLTSYPNPGVESGVVQETLYPCFDESRDSVGHVEGSLLAKIRRFVNAFLGILSIRCVARACKVTGPGDAILLVSGHMFPIALCGAFCSRRVLLFVLRDFSRITHYRPPALVAALKKFCLWLAERRNVVHFISIVNPETADECLNLGRPSTYIPAVGVHQGVVKIDRNKARQRLGLPVRPTMFLVFGVGHGGKDYPTVFEALQSVLGDAVVVFAGASFLGDPSNDADHLKQQFDVAQRVVIRNQFISDDEVALYFSAADVLLLSYKAGNVVDSGIVRSGVEYSLPMLGSDGGSIGKTIESWSLGSCFRGGDPQSLAAAIDRFLILDEGMLNSFANGRASYSAAHSWPQVAGAHLALYQRLNSELGLARKSRQGSEKGN